MPRVHAPPNPVRSTVVRTVRRLLRVPLGWKIVLGNAAILGLALAAWSAVLPRVAESPGWTGTGLIVLVVLGSATLNAALVLLALRPIHGIERTVERILAGDWSARAPESPLADPATERLRSLLNGVLEGAREREFAALELSRAVVRAEERERGRLSDEMYGETAQSLATLLLHLRVVERLATEGSAFDDASDAFGNTVREVLEGIRSIARRLRPPELHELGLRSAVDALARQHREGADAPRIVVMGDLPEERIDPDRRGALYRVIESALDNAVRHARAGTVEVLLRADADGIVVHVTDDGSGFDPDAVPADALGIPSMIERARVASGSLAIDSAPGRGTCVTMRVPWHDALPGPRIDAGAAFIPLER